MKKISFVLLAIILGCNLSVYAADSEEDTSPFGGQQINLSDDAVTGYVFNEIDATKHVEIKEEKKPVEKVEYEVASSTNPVATKFLQSLKKLSDQIKKDNEQGDVWHWSNSNNKRTFEDQNSSSYKVSNNALFVVWGLADCGIFKNGEKFYSRANGVLVWSDVNGCDTKATIKANADIIKVKGVAKDLITENKLLPGDICSTEDGGTVVYAGKNMWFNASRKGCETYEKNGEVYYKQILCPNSLTSNSEICKIIRLKDPESKTETPKEIVSTKYKESEKETESTTTASKKTGTDNREGFIASLKKINAIFEKDYKAGKPWFYSNSQNKKTIEEQLASGRKCNNCALYIVWALADCGVFKNKEKFYGHKKYEIRYCNTNSKATLAKYCTTTKITENKTARQLIKEGRIKPGDIVLYYAGHTNAYKGNNVFFDAGHGAKGYYKNGEYWFKKLESSSALGMRVTYVISFKDK